VNRNRSNLIDALLHSDEPSIRWKAMVRVAGEDPDSRKVKDLREEIRNSPRLGPEASPYIRLRCAALVKKMIA
jgi:hypothetical protein